MFVRTYLYTRGRTPVRVWVEVDPTASNATVENAFETIREAIEAEEVERYDEDGTVHIEWARESWMGRDALVGNEGDYEVRVIETRVL